MSNPNGDMSDAILASYEKVTGVNYNCVEIFADADPGWSTWVDPWPTSASFYGWDPWLAESSTHQIVLGQQLIPSSVCTATCSDPLAWESQCAAGAYNSYATQLGQNLVSAGAGNTVIRLGKEFNGGWENDWVGSPSDPNYVLEQQDWAKCFDNEVSAMRAVSGAHFLFDWNPAACDDGFSFADAYPGNAYVDIIGIDAYDEGCQSLKSAGEEGFSTLENEGGSGSTASIIAFAQSQGKPISFPEWGLNQGLGDDTTYINGIAGLVKSDDTAYESYFDCGCDTITPLGSSAPNSTAAYASAFG
jgi:hypothetical protein